MRDLRRNVTSEFVTDDQGNPTGGSTMAYDQPPQLTGTSTSQTKPRELIGELIWQNGILSMGRSGWTVEEVLEAALQRLQFFNTTKFRCRENSLAITKIEEALAWLDIRQRNREMQGVEDSYSTHES